MKLNLKRLKLHPGEKEIFILKKDKNHIALHERDINIKGDLDIEVEVENSQQIFLGRGKIKTILNLTCSRCLAEIYYPIDTNFFVSMVAENNKLKYTTADDDYDILYFNGDEVDIADCIAETIVFETPMVPLCKPECKGLCHVCGHNLNISVCNCTEDNIDPRLEKLKQFKNL